MCSFHLRIFSLLIFGSLCVTSDANDRGASSRKIIVIGGKNADGITKTIEAYDIESNRWSNLTDYPIALQGIRAVELDGAVYAVGGENAMVQSVSKVFMYVPTEDRWRESSAELETSRAHHSLAVVDGRIYAIGGTNTQNGFRVLHSAEMFAPLSAGSWTPIANMSLGPRTLFHLGVLDGQIYAVGGEFPQMSASEEKYSITEKK